MERNKIVYKMYMWASLFLFSILFLPYLVWGNPLLADRLKGKILLQVESHGEAWYVNPLDSRRYYMGRPDDAFQLMRSLGLGITNTDLAKVAQPQDVFIAPYDTGFAETVSGRILLQVEENGEAWYVNPDDYRRYFLGRPADAFEIMRSLGLGISNTDLSSIAEAHDVSIPSSSKQGADSTLSEESEITDAVTLDTGNAMITTDGSYRYITSNGIPNHETGAFPNSGNPNSISEQDHDFRVTLNPTFASEVTEYALGTVGVAINGIPFDPGAAEWYQNNQNSGWQYEALGGAINLGVDDNNAHVQPDGTYHYHGIPNGILQDVSQSMHSPLIGYAADGFPIYVRYSYENALESSSGIALLKSSYRIKSGSRPDGPGGTYDGSFVQDYEYVEGLGDLDECNGRFGVTPEYPNGIYYYVLTNTYPVIPRCLKGTPDSSFGMTGGPHGGGGPGGFPPPRLQGSHTHDGISWHLHE